MKFKTFAKKIFTFGTTKLGKIRRNPHGSSPNKSVTLSTKWIFSAGQTEFTNISRNKDTVVRVQHSNSCCQHGRFTELVWSYIRIFTTDSSQESRAAHVG